MSQQNVELARRAVDAFNERDLDAVLALAKDDCLYVVALPFDGEYRGHDGLRRWWKELFDAMPDFTAEIVEVRELGDWTVSGVRYRGHGAGSDAPFEQVRWQVGEWRDGKLVDDAYLRQRVRSARSRGAVGVADVAGERGPHLGRRTRRGTQGSSSGSWIT